MGKFPMETNFERIELLITKFINSLHVERINVNYLWFFRQQYIHMYNTGEKISYTLQSLESFKYCDRNKWNLNFWHNI